MLNIGSVLILRFLLWQLSFQNGFINTFVEDISTQFKVIKFIHSMFTAVKHKEKLLLAKTNSASSTTGDSNSFMMQHIRKGFINSAPV